MRSEKYTILWHVNTFLELSPWLSSKESACNAGDRGRRRGFVDWEDPLETEMAAHFSILAWKIAWTEEPGRLQPTGSQRVRHN